MKAYERLEKCLKAVREITDFKPEIAIVLGSGLGAFADEIDVKQVIDYGSIPGFPKSTVEGHKGRFVLGYCQGVPTVIMQGRVHYYEGYSMEDVVLPIRLMYMMGARTLVLTNASGGINTDYTAGDFMLITGHISNFVPNPLIGQNINELGVRFPDMTEAYNKELRNAIKAAAKELDIKLHEGVYVQLTGPSYESPDEIKMLRKMGADAVGMSTVCETIAARHMGMKVCGISCISNSAAGISENPLSHEEVQEAMNAAAPKFSKLINKTVANISKII